MNIDHREFSRLIWTVSFKMLLYSQRLSCPSEVRSGFNTEEPQVTDNLSFLYYSRVVLKSLNWLRSHECKDPFELTRSRVHLSYDSPRVTSFMIIPIYCSIHLNLASATSLCGAGGPCALDLMSSSINACY